MVTKRFSVYATMRELTRIAENAATHKGTYKCIVVYTFLAEILRRIIFDRDHLESVPSGS